MAACIFLKWVFSKALLTEEMPPEVCTGTQSKACCTGDSQQHPAMERDRAGSMITWPSRDRRVRLLLKIKEWLGVVIQT